MLDLDLASRGGRGKGEGGRKGGRIDEEGRGGGKERGDLIRRGLRGRGEEERGGKREGW